MFDFCIELANSIKKGNTFYKVLPFEYRHSYLEM